MVNAVQMWFGKQFYELHPLLQKLHKSGGRLSGKVHVKAARGFAGIIGRQLAKKFSIPVKETLQDFFVAISCSPEGLHWDRCFEQQVFMKSVFVPVGNIDAGYWLERTGSLRLKLSVDIKEGGWYWRCLGAAYKEIPVPLRLLPQIHAYKRIENDQYRFYVGFTLPLVGEVLSYSGLLDAHFTC